MSGLVFTFRLAIVSVTFWWFADLTVAGLLQAHPHAYLHYLVLLCRIPKIWGILSARTCAPRGGVWTKSQPVFRVRCPEFLCNKGLALCFDYFTGTGLILHGNRNHGICCLPYFLLFCPFRRDEPLSVRADRFPWFCGIICKFKITTG